MVEVRCMSETSEVRHRDGNSEFMSVFICVMIPRSDLLIFLVQCLILKREHEIFLHHVK